MLAHSYYEEDPRVRREAEALAAAGHGVDVFALRRPGDPGTVTIEGVVVHRLSVERHQGARLRVYLSGPGIFARWLVEVAMHDNGSTHLLRQTLSESRMLGKT